MTQFAECLNEMREHHKNNILHGKRARYIPSQRHAGFFANDNRSLLDEEGADLINGLELQAQALGREEADGNQAGITAETEKLKENNVSAEAQRKFREELEKKRAAAREKALQNVDKIYDEALAIGEKYPQYQHQVLNVADVISGFFNNLYEKIATFVINIVNSIVEWVKKAWESIKTTFNSIVSWISSWF